MVRRTAEPAAPTIDTLEIEALDRAFAEVEPVTARGLMVAGVRAFAAKGYHATTTRDIADQAGLSTGGLYVYYRSKEELLYRICLTGTQQSLDIIRAAESAADPDPRSRLRAVVTALTKRCAEFPMTSQIIEDQLGSLEEGHLAEVQDLRRRLEKIVRDIIAAGTDSGDFDVADMPVAAVAILSLTVDVARWYRRSARLTSDEVGALYADFAWRIVRSV